MISHLLELVSRYKDQLGIAISCSVFLLSLYVFLKARRDAKTQAILQYKSQLRQWADAAVDAVSETMYLIRVDPSRDPQGFFDKRHQLLWRMSSLVDRGRLFLPNRNTKLHGEHKEPSFRGFRHPVLDWLVLSHDLSQEINWEDARENRALMDKFVKCRRQLVSEVQAVLDSRKDIAALGNAFLIDPQQPVPDDRGYNEYLAIRQWLKERKDERAKRSAVAS